MKLLRIAFFFLALLCVCTVGDDAPDSVLPAATSASASKPVTESVKAADSQATTLEASVLTTTATRTTVEHTSTSLPSPPTTTQQITQGATTQPPTKVATTTAAAAADQTTTSIAAPQENGTQLTPQNRTLEAPSTKGSTLSSTTSLQKTTSTSGSSDLHLSSPTKSTASGSTGSSSGNKKGTESAIHYSSVILPVVITLIVITLSVFSLVALYRVCQKKTPERQENGTEQAQSDKEGVKLLSVKTTSPETVFVAVCDIHEVGFSLPSANLCEPPAPAASGEVSQGRSTGEHSAQGKSKTRQLFTPQQ
ncbi:endomucin isoform X2 [Calypte anna]|uniref:endomucin isoform X2 n=1 Tax=Calypte anna TaxID=9244 RepID=UPI0011C3A64E|nr:endomucin isoform X2 [Calypte anna]